MVSQRNTGASAGVLATEAIHGAKYDSQNRNNDACARVGPKRRVKVIWLEVFSLNNGFDKALSDDRLGKKDKRHRQRTETDRFRGEQARQQKEDDDADKPRAPFLRGRPQHTRNRLLLKTQA